MGDTFSPLSHVWSYSRLLLSLLWQVTLSPFRQVMHSTGQDYVMVRMWWFLLLLILLFCSFKGIPRVSVPSGTFIFSGASPPQAAKNTCCRMENLLLLLLLLCWHLCSPCWFSLVFFLGGGFFFCGVFLFVCLVWFLWLVVFFWLVVWWFWVCFCLFLFSSLPVVLLSLKYVFTVGTSLAEGLSHVSWSQLETSVSREGQSMPSPWRDQPCNPLLPTAWLMHPIYNTQSYPFF